MQWVTQIRRSSLVSTVLTPGCVWMMTITVTGALAVERPRYLISPVLIADVLWRYGVKVTPNEVQLPVSLSAIDPIPHLEIVSMTRVTDDVVQLQWRCRDAGECLPFYVLLNLPTVTATSLIASARLKSGLAVRTPGQGAGPAQLHTPEVPEQAMAKVHPGSHVTLLLEDLQMRIQLPAVALDSGSPGADIRVATPDHRKIFRATVVDQSVVKGDLE
ncbi:MAG TPA: flagella basal body P-ring formation protein FlgA [Acidobacteriaceae bacterium]|jgi:hypothetical protein